VHPAGDPRTDARRVGPSPAARFAQHPSVMLLIDPADGAIVDANEAAERFYGWDRDQLCRMRIDQLNTLTPAQVAAEMAAARAEERTYFAFRHRTAGGEVHDVEVYSGPVSEDGRTMLYSVVHVATERHRAVRALQESESFARSIVTNAPVGIVVVDLGGRIVRVNPQLSALTGYPEHELVGRHVLELTHPDDQPATQEAIERLQAGQLPSYEVEKRYVRRDGSVAHVRVWSGLLRDAAGRPAFQLGFVQDLSRLRQLEDRAHLADAALEASEERFAGLVAHITELVAVVDARGRISYASPSLVGFLGAAPTEVGRGLSEHVHPDDRRTLVDASRAAADAAGTPVQVGCRVRRSDGRWRDLRVTLTDLRTVPQIGGMVLNGHDVTELVQARQRLELQATHDGLTGLANRTLLLEHLHRHPEPGAALLLLDLEGFGAINDRIGPLAGDVLLRGVAARLEAVVPAGALLARTHGDEFALHVPRPCPDAEVEDLARSLLAAIGPSVEVPGGGAVPVGAHVGVAVAQAGGVAVSLLRDADLALTAARRGPAGTVVVCDPPLRAARARQLELEAGLASPDLEDQLQAVYQPLVDLDTGDLVAVEALVRWHHPTLGPVPPSEAIPLAETTGAILRLGRWMLRTATAQLAAWRRAGLAGDLAVAVNLSPRQFLDAELVATVRATLEAAELPAERLWVELTETAIGEDVDRAHDVLRSLADLGVDVHIDDFGTGFSSLAHLTRFPVAGLKIDRSFVARLLDDPHAGAVVTAILELARSLDLHVVAEGIEEVGQYAWLRRNGCDTGQGYLWSPPLPADELSEGLRSGRFEVAWSPVSRRCAGS
jgi:PAS domain S-box-containing protein/diguanylate cyclase (GGDEF)-like protein